MAATAVALKLDDNHYEVAWVGDSRAYLWDKTLYRLTRDHTYIQRLVDIGELTTEEARIHPERSFMTQALGTLSPEGVAVDSVTGILSQGDQIILCSDGLTDQISDGEMTVVMSQQLSEQEKVDSLITLALNSSVSDNITILIVSV